MVFCPVYDRDLPLHYAESKTGLLSQSGDGVYLILIEVIFERTIYDGWLFSPQSCLWERF